MFDLTPEEARLLLKIAMMAIGRNRFASAAKILAVLERFRPDQAAVACTNAIALISALKFQAAVDYIDSEALKRFPESAMLKAFKGMALLRLNRRDEANEVLAEAARSEEDPAAAKLASDMLVEG
ncbi:MAG: hypothetical protein MJ109_02290 [Kiritimatiellae bacterium]|nr:hypothetical protein [Kiritimatiellia bacterium]